MSIIVWLLVAGICLLQFADYWTTAKILQRGGTELNPVMRFLFRGLGMRTGLLIGKFYVALMAAVGAWLGWWNGDGFALLVMVFVVYAVVVTFNWNEYRKGNHG